VETKESTSNSDKSPQYIVGIGASAGGLEPIHELFDNMPDDTNFAFVIIQHLSPDHKSLMGELLAKHTNMSIVEAAENMLLKANCIYLIPSKKVMTLSDGQCDRCIFRGTRHGERKKCSGDRVVRYRV
jgi:two-component system, chemotaxis family, CheB/CheR fusion protein